MCAMMVGRLVAVLAAVSVVAEGVRHKRKRPSVLSTCGAKGASAPSGQIVNGEDATECEWRWQAQLQRNGRTFCGGSLITPEWVLTAAHCVSSADFDVVMGDHDRTKNSTHQQKRSAVSVWQHPGWGSGRNDLALVHLDSPVTINDCVGTVCLPSAGDDVADNTSCWITGWGTLHVGGALANILQEAQVGIVSNHDCCNKFGYSCNQIQDSMICAQGRLPNGSITDACQGDSGGPLVCDTNGKWTLYGATSWGRGCAGEHYPGVWARVHDEVDWIEETVANPPAPTPPPPAQCLAACRPYHCAGNPHLCGGCSFC